MPRPIWKGHISFGLVNVPVTLYSAEARVDLHFKLIDGRNHAGIRYQKVNEVTGDEVPWNEIVKAYEHSDGEFVLMNDEDFKRAAPEATETVEIVDFVPESAIVAEYFDKPYYLVPSKQGQKSYALLRETMRRTEKIAIAKVVIRTREYVAAVMVRGRALMLNLLRFQQELREIPEENLPPLGLEKLKISDRELEMSEQLLESMSSDWKPEQYKDEYRESLLAYIEEKVSKGETNAVAEEPRDEEEEESGSTLSIVELLRRSMSGRSSSKSEGTSEGKSSAESKSKCESKEESEPKSRRPRVSKSGASKKKSA